MVTTGAAGYQPPRVPSGRVSTLCLRVAGRWRQRLQLGVGAAAEQRVEALHVGDQLQVQGAGLDALHHLLGQAVDMGVGQAAFLPAETMLLLQQAAGVVAVGVVPRETSAADKAVADAGFSFDQGGLLGMLPPRVLLQHQLPIKR